MKQKKFELKSSSSKAAYSEENSQKYPLWPQQSTEKAKFLKAEAKAEP